MNTKCGTGFLETAVIAKCDGNIYLRVEDNENAVIVNISVMDAMIFRDELIAAITKHYKDKAKRAVENEKENK